MEKIFGYCRVSTIKQNIERQIRNLKEKYPDIIILQEEYTGRTINRPQYILLKQIVNSGDKIVFDSVSRMSRNAEEGYTDYMEFWNKNIHLEFLNEPYLNTELFNSQLKGLDFNIKTDETFEPLIEGIKHTLKNIIKKQIKIGFEQSEKEVLDLSERTKQGLITARLNGKTLGRPKRQVPEGIIQDIKDNYINSRKKSVKDFLETYKISKSTFYNYLNDIEKEREE